MLKNSEKFLDSVNEVRNRSFKWFDPKITRNQKRVSLERPMHLEKRLIHTWLDNYQRMIQMLMIIWPLSKENKLIDYIVIKVII